MADKKKKMSVAEMLAAARKADSKGGADETGSGSTKEPVADSGAAPEPIQQATKPEGKPSAAKSGSGGRPSVADILAAARTGGKGAEGKPATAKKSAPKAAVEKKAAGKKGAATSAKKSDTAGTGPAPRDTASILAAARKSTKPGPISKSEAAAKASKKQAGDVAGAKKKLPPMPPKPSYAKPKQKAAQVDGDRRQLTAGLSAFMAWAFGGALNIGMTSLAITGGVWTLATARFMFPNVLREPPSKFKVGFPDDFAAGQVDTRFKAKYGIWIVNGEYEGKPEIYALSTVCTHLGCTPNWLEGEQKFKCPCHGSGFYKDGINFEGPAPRPLERYAIHVSDDGQIEVDKSLKFQQEMGQWEDSQSYVSV